MATPPLPCQTIDPETFFPIGDTSASDQLAIETAKSHCRRCPIQEACLGWALDERIGYGVWGGHTTTERSRMLPHYLARKAVGHETEVPTLSSTLQALARV